MRFEIKVLPGAKHEQIEKISDTQLKVKVKTRALEGKANERLIDVLSEYFQVPKSNVQILKGAKTKNKLVEIKIE
jgi:uncharacterized protein (TIGR00251 family)